MREYVEKFLEIANQCEIITEFEKIIQFTTNCDKRVEGYVSMFNPQTLSQTITLAKTYWEHLTISNTSKPNKFQSKNEDGNLNWVRGYGGSALVNCYACGRRGHYANECYRNQRNHWYRSRESQRGSGRKEVRFARDRTSSRGRQSGRSNYGRTSRDSSGRSKSNSRTRYETRSILYRSPSNDRIRNQEQFNTNDGFSSNNYFNNPKSSREIKKRRAEDDEPMNIDIIDARWVENYEFKKDQITTLANINDIEIEVVIDSGATHSVASNQIAQRLGLELHSTNRRLRVADGRIIPATGIAKQTPIVVHGVHTEIDIVVMPMNQDKLLLGVDWLVRMDDTINM
jgi:predicted aspartyl protease